MENIPPGLRQQLTMVRALATRLRVILFDNADRGLDRAGYARLIASLDESAVRPQ